MMAARKPEHGPLVLRRRFAVAPPAVWRAWTEPGALRVWFGQGDAEGWRAEMDVRAGGRYRLTMRGPQGGYYHAYGAYREVVEGRKLVFTWSWKQGRDSEAVITVVFSAAEGGTDVEFTLDPVVDQQEREAWRADFTRLERYLQEAGA